MTCKCQPTPLTFLPPASVVCEGYVFTHVCHSVHRGGGGVRDCSRGTCVVAGAEGGGRLWACMVAPGGACVVAWGAYVVAPGGMGAACVVALGGGVCGCSGGHAWLLWGGCVVAPGGHAWDMTRYGDTVNERAVCILLECILVLHSFHRLSPTAASLFIFCASLRGRLLTSFWTIYSLSNLTHRLNSNETTARQAFLFSSHFMALRLLAR